MNNPSLPRCSTTVYGKFPSFDFGSVTVVDRVSALPASSKVCSFAFYASRYV